MIRLLLTLLCIVFVFIGCEKSDKPQTTTFYGVAMTVPYRIVVGRDLGTADQLQVNKVILEVFEQIDQTYNKWNPHSELSKLNQTKAGQKILLSKPLEDFLKQTDKLVILAEGKFDPTIESVQKVWKHHFKEGKIPSDEEVKRAAVSVGWDKIHVSDGQFWKDHDLVEIDLGGIAKGYAIDLLVEKLNAAGFPDLYVEWGGEIRTSGSHPDQRPWRIFVSRMGDPDPETALAVVDLQDNAVASSGDYQQNWTIDGITYFHIINPQTCKPLIATKKSICSATILAPNCMLADVLATTAMLFGTPEESEAWLKKVQSVISGIKYWIETREEK